jgi:hypothetical protein
MNKPRLEIYKYNMTYGLTFKFHILVNKMENIANTVLCVPGTNLLKICYEIYNKALSYDLKMEFPDNLWIWLLSMGASISHLSLAFLLHGRGAYKSSHVLESVCEMRRSAFLRRRFQD